MLINYVELNISKESFLKSKINGVQFKHVGSFGKHIKSHGYSLIDYTLTFYNDLVPKCLITNEPSDYKITGYWNRWYPIKYEHRFFIGKLKNLQRKIETVKNKNLYTDYLSFNYWVNSIGFVETVEMLDWLIDKKWYVRLHDSFYDHTWTDMGKINYINSILGKAPNKLNPIDTLQGMQDRGNDKDRARKLLTDVTSKRKPNKYTYAGMLLEGYNPDEIPGLLKEYYDNKPSTFRNPEIQKSNNARKLAKYSKSDLRKFTVRCVEYWLERGYNMDESIQQVSEIQKNNTLNAIQKRFNCTDSEAVDIQNEIYNKRAATLSKKSVEELNDIRSRQDSGSYEYCLRKTNYNISDAKKLHKELATKRTSRIFPFGRASKESLKYFIPLYRQLRNIGINRHNIYFGVKGSREYHLFSEDSVKFYDFTILCQKLIIEYDGIYWHSSINAKDNDKLKTQLAIKNGFKILRISSNDSVEHNKKMINEFIKQNIKIDNSNWGIV